MKQLIVIAGPTASGKTELAIQLANHFKTEIVSCDSRQVFKEMSIGTAKPTPEELNRAKHHFISSHSITEEFSAGDFERQGLELLQKLFETHDQVIMVGGSGLYVRALCEGLDVFPEVDASFREDLIEELDKNGLEPLQQELFVKDPAYYEKVDLNNSQRVIRALEVCRGTGQPVSSFRVDAKLPRDFESIKVGVSLERDVLYDRINRRVDLMLEAGLLDEVKSLESQKHLNALQTVGYKEFFDHFEGLHSMEEAIELVKRNTRRYAKRQITWFKKEPGLEWIENPDLEKVLSFLKGKNHI